MMDEFPEYIKACPNHDHRHNIETRCKEERVRIAGIIKTSQDQYKKTGNPVCVKFEIASDGNNVRVSVGVRKKLSAELFERYKDNLKCVTGRPRGVEHWETVPREGSVHNEYAIYFE